MTPAETIARALERLERVYATAGDNVIDEPLAALIRAASEPHHVAHDRHCCWCCDGDVSDDDCPVEHHPDCALIALCRAVVGQS